MRSDTYTKIVLTVIAACLLVLTIRVLNVAPVLRAATSYSCTGELKANAWGGVEATIGGYTVRVTCD